MLITGESGTGDGAFALADSGTLFLDEVGELTPTRGPEGPSHLGGGCRPWAPDGEI